VVEHLCSKLKTLSSSPSTRKKAKTNKQTNHFSVFGKNRAGHMISLVVAT
jgi:hypothetical protein